MVPLLILVTPDIGDLELQQDRRIDLVEEVDLRLSCRFGKLPVTPSWMTWKWTGMIALLLNSTWLLRSAERTRWVRLMS